MLLGALTVLPAAARANLIQFTLAAVATTPATTWADDGAYQRTASRTIWTDLGSVYTS
jgi:hypothetical protein